MKKVILLALALVGMTLVFTTTASAQQKKFDVRVDSKPVTANRGSNPNIKSGPPTKDEPQAKSRGTCSVYFSNYTGLYINIYVDGYYKGQISPYGGGTVYVGDGYTTIYCISAGGTRDWSASGNCSGSYTYRLY